MDARFHYKNQMAIVSKLYLAKCRTAHGSPPPDNNTTHVCRGGFFNNINNWVVERKEHNVEGNPRPGLVHVKEEKIWNVISLSRLGNLELAQPYGASRGRTKDANDGVSKSRVQSGNTFPGSLRMVDQLGSLPHANILLQRPKVENRFDFSLEKYKMEVSMHPPQNEFESSMLNFQQQCQVEYSRSTSLKRKGVTTMALDLEEVQRVKIPKIKYENLEVKTTDLSNLLDDLSKDFDVDDLDDGHNDLDEKYDWDTLWGDSSMRVEKGFIKGLHGLSEIQVEDTNVDSVGNANCVAFEIQDGNTNSTPMDHQKHKVLCSNTDNDDDNMAICDWHIDDSHCGELTKMEIEDDNSPIHTNMDAEETEEKNYVVSSITAFGRFMHAKPLVASSLADVPSDGNLATPPPWSKVNLEGMNGRASSLFPVKSLCDQVQLSRTTYGQGVSNFGPITCGTSHHSKPSSTHIPPLGNPSGCILGSSFVLHGKNGLKVVDPPLHVQIPNEQVHLSRAAFGHGISYSSEHEPSTLDNCRPCSKTRNQSGHSLTWNNKTKKTSKLKQWRRKHFKEQLCRRQSAEELKKRESVGKVHGSPTAKGIVRHTMHSFSSTPLPSLLGTSKTQARHGLSMAQCSKPTLVPSYSENEKSSQQQGSKNIRNCPVHGIVDYISQPKNQPPSNSDVKVESIVEGNKSLGPVKNETNTSPVTNIRSVNREKNNQLFLVKPVHDTTITTPRDVVTRTLESYDYHVRVASLKLQEERREHAQQGRGVGHSPTQMRGMGHFPCCSLTHARGTGQSLASSSHRPDIQAYTAIRDAQEDVHRQMVLGDVPGVEIGDRYKFRHRMAVVGLHHLPNCGIAFGTHPPDNISLASAVVYVPKGGYADNVDNGHEVIYTGQGGRADRTQGSPFIEHQKAEKGNKALLMNIDLDVPVRMIRAHMDMTRASNTKTLGYTYDGLYRVDSFKYELGVGGYNVYKFLLRRLDHQPPIPPCIEGCTTHPWNDDQGAFTPLPLQVVAPEYEVQQVLGVAEDDDSECHGV